MTDSIGFGIFGSLLSLALVAYCIYAVTKTTGGLQTFYYALVILNVIGLLFWVNGVINRI